MADAPTPEEIARCLHRSLGYLPRMRGVYCLSIGCGTRWLRTRGGRVGGITISALDMDFDRVHALSPPPRTEEEPAKIDPETCAYCAFVGAPCDLHLPPAPSQPQKATHPFVECSAQPRGWHSAENCTIGCHHLADATRGAKRRFCGLPASDPIHAAHTEQP